jgi:DNA-binding beta-propeller fold protein YncE
VCTVRSPWSIKLPCGSNEYGKTLTVLNAIDDQVLATVDVGGEAGNNRYDAVRDLIWVAVQSRDEIVSVNPETWRVTARYATPPGTHPHGLFAVADRGVLFIAGEASGRLHLFDLSAREFGASWPVGPSPDVLAYDADLGRLYVASESGKISVFALEGTRVTKLGDQFVAPDAHVIEVDPATHQLYLPIRALHGRPIMLVMAPLAQP